MINKKYLIKVDLHATLLLKIKNDSILDFPRVSWKEETKRYPTVVVYIAFMFMTAL